MNKKHIITLITLPCALMGTVITTQAMDENDYHPETVTSRERPELAPLGARAGAFRLFPSITLQERYEDNIFATSNNEVDDFVTVIRPALNIQSLWGRHALNFRTDAELGRYADNGNEDYTDFTTELSGRLDLNHAQRLNASYRFSDQHEERSSPDDVNGIEPTQFDTHRFNLNYRRTYNRISVELAGNYRQTDYDDVLSSTGNVINNDDRDRDRLEGSIKLGYDLLPGYTAYVRTAINSVDYDNVIDGQTFDRDSDGLSIDVGTDLDLSGTLYGDVYVGYTEQDYDAVALGKVSGISGGASLTWLASEMTTVSGSVNRSIEETNQQRGTNFASGIFNTRANLTIDHELLRNLLVQGRLRVSEDDFEGIDQSDTYFGTGLGATYMINRHFQLIMDYDYLQRDSDAVTNDNDYSENRFSLGGRLQL